MRFSISGLSCAVIPTRSASCAAEDQARLLPPFRRRSYAPVDLCTCGPPVHSDSRPRLVGFSRRGPLRGDPAPLPARGRGSHRPSGAIPASTATPLAKPAPAPPAAAARASRRARSPRPSATYGRRSRALTVACGCSLGGQWIGCTFARPANCGTSSSARSNCTVEPCA